MYTLRIKRFPKLLGFRGTGLATPLGIVVAENASEAVPAHESRHVLQMWLCCLLGIPLALSTKLGWIFCIPPVNFLIIYLANFVINRFFYPSWYEAYRAIFFEKDSRSYAGQEV